MPRGGKGKIQGNADPKHNDGHRSGKPGTSNVTSTGRKKKMPKPGRK